MENQICNFCGSEFSADPREIKRGNAKFCSLSCACKYGNTKKQRYECSCIVCNVVFEAQVSNAKYCSDKCKTKQYRLNKKDDNDLTKKQIDDLALLPCANCGWDLGPRDVHHIQMVSRGGKNSQENLITLCPNCHRLSHRKLLSEETLTQLMLLRG
jgi:5-methylcytosine-specific restriction endonuclease McrA